MATKKKYPSSCRVWDTFLRIPDPSTTDLAPVADAGWLEAKGVSASAPIVLRLLRREVLPLVRRRHDQPIRGYFFLVHNRESGVPTTKEDKGAYIHMRLYFYDAKTPQQVAKLIGDQWEMTRPIREESEDIAGIDRKFVRSGSADAIREILKAQSELVLKIIETYTDDVDTLVLIGQVRQCLHYVANMCQIKVVG